MDEMGPIFSAQGRRLQADGLATTLLRLQLGSVPQGTAQRRRSILESAIQQEVIPQLLALHAHAEVSDPPSPISNGQVAHLVELTLRPASSEALAFVMTLHGEGIAAETLYLDLLGPAARRLGELWVDDVCDFSQVTIGVIHLQHAMRALGPAFFADAQQRAAGRRALLVPMPGEQHSFGLHMLFDFFRRAGWNAWTGPIGSREELGRMVTDHWVDLVGISLACDERLEGARAEIRAVRLASCNSGLIVMVGGPPFIADPRLAAAIGADGTARDGREAVAQADALVGQSAARVQAERPPPEQPVGRPVRRAE